MRWSAFLAMAVAGMLLSRIGIAQEMPGGSPTPLPPAVTNAPGTSPFSTPGARPRMAVDPILVPDCRLTVPEKQDVPSQRDAVLLAYATEIRQGETVTPDRLLVVKVGDQERKYRRLREGDTVEAGQLVAVLDDRLARDEFAIKKGQVAVSEAELSAAERARDEAKDRYVTQLKLKSSPVGPATSDEDVGGAKVVWYRNHYEAVSKKETITLARLELHQAETVLGMYEIRTKIPGLIKRFYKHPGEAVKSLEPVAEVYNLGRLRAEGLVSIEHVPHLQEGMTASLSICQMQSPQLTLNGHLQEISAVAVSKDAANPAILSASDDGTVRVWDPLTRRESRVLRHPAGVRAVACTPPSAAANWCLAGTADGSAYLWDLSSQSPAPRLVFKGGHHGAITSVAFSPDGKLCLTGGDDREICLWETTTGALRSRFPPGHVGGISMLQFPLPTKIISAGRDNTVRLWTLSDKGAALENTFDHRSGDVSQLGVSADAKRLLFDQGNALQVLTLPEGVSEGILHPPSAPASFATFALFSPDAGWILTAGYAEGRLQLWRAPTAGQRSCELRQFVSPEHSVATCAAFAPDGSFIVAGTRDRQVLVWPLPARDELERQVPATITLVERVAETSARQVRIWAELANPDGTLIPGTSATMTINPNP